MSNALSSLSNSSLLIAALVMGVPSVESDRAFFALEGPSPEAVLFLRKGGKASSSECTEEESVGSSLILGASRTAVEVEGVRWE